MCRSQLRSHGARETSMDIHSLCARHIRQLAATARDPPDEDEGIFGCWHGHPKSAPNSSMRIILVGRDHSPRIHSGPGRPGLAPSRFVSLSVSHPTNASLSSSPTDGRRRRRRRSEDRMGPSFRCRGVQVSDEI
ncbi:hypothetical protein MPTK1_7g14240 [Marchantia polymorpha subsp. ruderalis]|uniref:Uncharacterized protein n=2 Tax=Marchantia polymorpha TaxID=3197 RepID=A0AAF6BZG7_MARPO|nr:hypothetical protein MARPO_0009s0109 [Marchantia polymorpha]BBN17401.1 hypothetical protein Mp_7g14240 [Marchantia polymorpha subsp. ruderalis]|eukprot:PTQ47006.1 hypothetical protein MARPO_0009s0109 [Marchantia polymorpha]